MIDKAKTDTGQPVNVTIIQPDKAAEGAANQAKAQEILAAAEKPGVYEVAGKLVDGNGDPVKHGSS